MGGFLPTIVKNLGYSNARVGPLHNRLSVCLTWRPGAIIHRPAIRGRSRFHATSHDLFRPISNTRCPNFSGIHHRYRRLGDPPRTTGSWRDARSAAREVLWMYLRSYCRIHQYSAYHLYVPSRLFDWNVGIDNRYSVASWKYGQSIAKSHLPRDAQHSRSMPLARGSFSVSGPLIFPDS